MKSAYIIGTAISVLFSFIAPFVFIPCAIASAYAAWEEWRN